MGEMAVLLVSRLMVRIRVITKGVEGRTGTRSVQYLAISLHGNSTNLAREVRHAVPYDRNLIRMGQAYPNGTLSTT
jgi:hypothetical protein